MNARSILFAPLLSVLASAGCAINGPNDALTGTWTNTSCYGSTDMPADIQSCSISLAFASDLSVSLTDVRQSQPATALYPRCTTTRRVTGQRYSTSDPANTSRTVTITGTGTSTLERTGCANATDNAAPVADSADSIPSGPMAYELSADILTLPAGSLAGHYNRSLL